MEAGSAGANPAKRKISKEVGMSHADVKKFLEELKISSR
jgi:hypothetical protein